MYVNMIFDSSTKSFNLLKSALLFFDEINVQYPETDQVVYNLPRDYGLIAPPQFNGTIISCMSK